MKFRLVTAIAAVATAVSSFTAMATDYFVSSAKGNDGHSGVSAAQAWKTLGRISKAGLKPGDRVLLERGGLWRETLKAQSGAPGKPIVFTSYGKGEKPLIQPSVEKSAPSDWTEVESGLWASPIDTKDVGLIVFNHGEKWGFKKIWNDPEATWKYGWGNRVYNTNRLVGVKKDLDFSYEPPFKRVVVKSVENPARRFRSIELLVAKHGVDESGCHDVIYDGLAVRYAGCHGFGGGSTRNIIIRNCDISWIGGALQFWGKDKSGRRTVPVRFGNGIEFWGNCASNLVERCRLWEIYDAALTNQGMKDSETDIIWRDNVIWNSEYSFEYWNGKYSRNVVFEHNTCIDAGYGWGNAQRPDPNGAHLMFYAHPCEQHGIVVRDNLFVNAKQWSARIGLDWREELTIDNNLFWNEDAKVPYCRWLEGKELKLADYAAMRALGFQTSGFNMKPDFVDAAKRDYRLTEGSVGKRAGSDGADLGSRW